MKVNEGVLIPQDPADLAWLPGSWALSAGTSVPDPYTLHTTRPGGSPLPLEPYTLWCGEQNKAKPKPPHWGGRQGTSGDCHLEDSGAQRKRVRAKVLRSGPRSPGRTAGGRKGSLDQETPSPSHIMMTKRYRGKPGRLFCPWPPSAAAEYFINLRHLRGGSDITVEAEAAFTPKRVG